MMTLAFPAPSRRLLAREHGVLARAICQAPDNDALRYEFADVLDQNGRREWAEAVRLQLEIAANQKAGTPRKVNSALGKRWWELARKHWVEWVHPLEHVAGKPTLWTWDFRRGFVETVTLSPRAMVENAEALFSHQPIAEVRLKLGPMHIVPWRDYPTGQCSFRDAGNEGGPVGRLSRLPTPIFERLHQTGIDCIPDVGECVFGNFQEAMTAASRACVMLGREVAGLPQLDWDNEDSRRPRPVGWSVA